MVPAEVGIAAAAIAAAAGGFGYLVKARTDWKQGNAADVAALVQVKDEMIETLREQNDDLRVRLEKTSGDVDELRRRLGVVEHDYRTLLKRAIDLGVCANAPTCVNYVPPGDRREGKTG